MSAPTSAEGQSIPVEKPTPTGGKPPRRKVKDSCDLCSKRKVKCGKERPSCLRCSSLNLPCNYSPSRRIGKPPASKRKAALQQQGFTNGFVRQDSTYGSCTPEFMPGFNDQTMNHQQPLFFPPETLHLSPPTSIGMFPPQPMPMPDRYLMDMYLDFEGSTASVHSGMVPMDDFPTPPLSDESFDDSFKPFPDIIPTTELPERCSKDHDCMSLGITALQNLYGVAELARSSLSADRVLDRNRKAIDAISQLVDCECAADPELALLLSLIISKVLRTYRTVTAQRSASCSSSSSVSEGSQDFGLHTGETDAAFTLGSYRLDEEDEESIKMQLILRQLKRMGSLVDRFVHVYSRQRLHGSEISGALTTFVRGEFKASLKESSDRLNSSMRELF